GQTQLSSPPYCCNCRAPPSAVSEFALRSAPRRETPGVQIARAFPRALARGHAGPDKAFQIWGPSETPLPVSATFGLGAGGLERARDRVQSLGIDPVLLSQDARRQRLGVVAGENRHSRLGDDRSGVELGGD